MKNKPPMVYLVWGLILLLVVLHQDNWFWDNGTLVFGFMPVALLYHACISIGAGITWFLATRFAWPEYLADDDLDIDDDGDSPDNDVDLGGDDDLGISSGGDDDDERDE